MDDDIKYDSIFSNAFRESLNKTKCSITDEISYISKGDEPRADSIKSLYLDTTINTDDKSQITSELLLSYALGSCELCSSSFDCGDLPEAFEQLALANICLGASRGGGAEQIKTDIKKSMIQNNAADVRHGKNRILKDKAEQYYLDNLKNFKNKDEAAEHILQHVVPERAFSTIRKWLTNLGPKYNA